MGKEDGPDLRSGSEQDQKYGRAYGLPLTWRG